MNKVAQDAVKNTEAMVKDAQGAFQQAFDKFSKSVADVNEFGKANFEAVIKSGEISSKSAEAISKEVADLAKKNFDEAVKAAQDIAAVKSVGELVEKQTAFAKSAFENYTAQLKKLAELATNGTKDAFAPINARVEAAGEFAKKAQA